MDLKELLFLLEKRLSEHDANRKEIQSKLKEICSKKVVETNSLEEKVNEEIQYSFNSTEERILAIIEKLNVINNNKIIGNLIKQTQRELSTEVKFEIQYIKNAEYFTDSYELKITKVPKMNKISNKGSVEHIINELQIYVNKLSESLLDTLNKMAEICAKECKRADELEKRISDKLESLFSQEDARLQKAVNMIKEVISCDNPKGQEESILQAKTALLVKQSYILSTSSLREYPLYGYDFDVIREVFLNFINFEERKTSIFTVSHIKKEGLTVFSTFFRDEEKKLLKSCKLSLKAALYFREKDSNADSGKTLTKELSLRDEKPINFSYTFPASTTYLLKMRIECNELTTKWSDETEFITPEFDACCMWKKCPSNIDYLNKYSLESDNKVATKANLYVYIDDDRGYIEYEQESGSCTPS